MKKSMLALALIAASGSALAQSPNWDKIDVSYLDTDIDVGFGEASFDGFGLNGSVGVGYEMYRPSDADLDIDTLSASFRYAF